MKKHTPGPWSFDEDGTVFKGKNRLLIAEVAQQGMGYAASANTRLVAAAPDLLAALQSVMTWWAESVPLNGADDDMPPLIFDAAWSAIAKATGEQA